MPHVDEGILHAYLDGALEDVAAAGELPDAMTAADVVTHFELCADCRSRLEAERAIREQAGMILRDVSIPHVTIPDTPPVSRRATRRRFVPLAWAASVVMAVGAGWIAGIQMRDADRIAEFASPTAAAPATDGEQTADASTRMAEGDESSEARPDDAMPGAASPTTVVAAEAGPEAQPRVPAPAPATPAAKSVDAAVTAVPPSAADMAAGEVAVSRRESAGLAAADDAAAQRAVSSFAAVDDAQRSFQALLDRTIAAGDSAISWRAASSTDVAMMPRGVFGIRDAAVERVEVAANERALVRLTQSLPSGVTVELIQWQSAEHQLGPALARAAPAEADVAGNAAQPRHAYVRTLADGRTEIVLNDTMYSTWVAVRAMIERGELSRIVQERVVRRPITVP